MTYTYPTTRKRRAAAPPAHQIKTEKAEKEKIGPVQGITPGSVQEWRVAMALVKLGLPFAFQVPLRYGRSRRGGQVVDFVVYTPRPIPTQIYGTYWHRSATGPEDELKLAYLRNLYKVEPVVLEEEDLESMAQAIEAVRRAFL